MWLKRSCLALWIGAVLGYIEGIDAFQSLEALSTAALYAVFAGAELYVAGNLIAD